MSDSPFSREYWRRAAAECRRPRILVFSALMIAACVALSYVPSLFLADGVKVTWGFLARSLCALVGGPVNALLFGLAEDTVSFLLNPQGPYFPGYALTTMLGTFLYALFLYRTDVTPLRVALAKLSNSVLNLVLGSLWSAILYSRGYLYYVATRAVSYVVTLPVQIALLCLLFAAILPILNRMGLCPYRFRTGPKKAPPRP